MAEIVITGGQGFLGKNLTERLVKNGLDVCSTYSYTPPVNIWKTPNLSLFKLDVTKFEDCLKLINQENPRLIYHLVAQPLVTAAARHPFPTFELTVRGAYNLLEAVRQTGKDCKVVMFTSDKVYGENMDAKETDRLDTVSNTYDIAKTCEDLIGRSYSQYFPVITVRSANVYGRYDLHWDRLIPHLCKEISQGRTPVFRSDGKMLRDYIYVDDVLDGLILASEKVPSGSSMNLGAKRSYSALEILDNILKISGRIDLSPASFGKASGEIINQHINYEYAKSLGWFPKVSLEDGLERTFRWYQGWLS